MYGIYVFICSIISTSVKLEVRITLSEIGEFWLPNTAPETMATRTNAASIPKGKIIGTNIGTKTAMVPLLVPVEQAIMVAVIEATHNIKVLGMICICWDRKAAVCKTESRLLKA